jgi:hypothetical protein
VPRTLVGSRGAGPAPAPRCLGWTTGRSPYFEGAGYDPVARVYRTALNYLGTDRRIVLRLVACGLNPRKCSTYLGDIPVRFVPARRFLRKDQAHA